MGRDQAKGNENAYFRARKNAAAYREALYSREGAAELLGVSVSTLADYELGNTKVVPVDKVVLMADLYGCPELRHQYCKNECPIGRDMPIATEARGIEGIALRIMRRLDPDELKRIKDDLAEIAEDGVVSEDEKPRLEEILKRLDEIAEALSELRIAGEKAIRRKAPPGEEGGRS